MRRWKNIFHANGKQKKAGVPILISDKIDLKIKKITRDKEGHYIMIKGSIQEEDITILNTQHTTTYNATSNFCHQSVQNKTKKLPIKWTKFDLKPKLNVQDTYVNHEFFSHGEMILFASQSLCSFIDPICASKSLSQLGGSHGSLPTTAYCRAGRTNLLLSEF